MGDLPGRVCCLYSTHPGQCQNPRLSGVHSQILAGIRCGKSAMVNIRMESVIVVRPGKKKLF